MIKLTFLAVTLLIVACNTQAEEEEDEYANLLKDLIGEDEEYPPVHGGDGDRVEHHLHHPDESSDGGDGPEEAGVHVAQGLNKGSWGLQEPSGTDDDDANDD